MSPIPITIVTGFLGSGKTTLILNLIPQLPKEYKIALLKNEFGDLAIDSQLASSAAISGVEELLNGCICCNLVGQLGEALETLRKDVTPDRIIIETSGSAFPATLALEVNRLAAETGHYTLDGVVVVIDVENWQGYEDTSYTAKMQARYTDLIVFNKWERLSERRYEECLDRVGDLEIEVATVKSDKGKVPHEVLLGVDGRIARDLSDLMCESSVGEAPKADHAEHDHDSSHQEEVEVLSVVLTSDATNPALSVDSLETFVLAAPKTEIYRTKTIFKASRPPPSSSGDVGEPAVSQDHLHPVYILNWAFGRWTVTPINRPALKVEANTQTSRADGKAGEQEHKIVCRMTVVLARGESKAWTRRIREQGYVETEDEDTTSRLEIKRLL